MNVATKLSEARKLIERGWCQDVFARGKSGYKVRALSPVACSFCAVGALMRTSQTEFATDVYEEILALRKVVGFSNVTHWNDAPERTQTEVIEAFKRAEQLARDSAE